MKIIKERYKTDSAFRTLVDTMHVFIEKGDFTPTEIREAAMLAQIKYEEWHPRKTVFTKDEVMLGEV